MNKELFGKRLKALRQERDLGQKEVGAWIDLQKSTMSLYESGKVDPPYDKLKILAQKFDVSIEYLAGDSDNRTLYTIAANRGKNDPASMLSEEGQKELDKYMDYLLTKYSKKKE